MRVCVLSLLPRKMFNKSTALPVQPSTPRQACTYTSLQTPVPAPGGRWRGGLAHRKCCSSPLCIPCCTQSWWHWWTGSCAHSNTLPQTPTRRRGSPCQDRGTPLKLGWRGVLPRAFIPQPSLQLDSRTITPHSHIPCGRKGCVAKHRLWV